MVGVLVLLNFHSSVCSLMPISVTVKESFRVIRPSLREVRGGPTLIWLVWWYYIYKRMKQIGDGARTATRTLDMEWRSFQCWRSSKGSKPRLGGLSVSVFIKGMSSIGGGCQRCAVSGFIPPSGLNLGTLAYGDKIPHLYQWYESCNVILNAFIVTLKSGQLSCHFWKLWLYIITV